MSAMVAKLGDVKRRLFSAIEDVPDTLIGTIIILTLLTIVALSILMFLGYQATTY
jgi:hypothetical protein